MHVAIQEVAKNFHVHKGMSTAYHFDKLSPLIYSVWLVNAIQQSLYLLGTIHLLTWPVLEYTCTITYHDSSSITGEDCINANKLTMHIIVTTFNCDCSYFCGLCTGFSLHLSTYILHTRSLSLSIGSIIIILYTCAPVAYVWVYVHVTILSLKF